MVIIEEEKGAGCTPLEKALCPYCASFSVFWKIAFGIHIALMVTFAATLLFVTIGINRDIEENRRAKQEVLTSIREHTKATMENRAIQAEVKGLLHFLVDQGRDGTKKGR